MESNGWTRKYAALATLINLGSLTKKQLRRELRKIKYTADLLLILPMITDAMRLRSALGVLINHKSCTSNLLFDLFQDTYYADYQDILSDTLLREFGHGTFEFIKFLAHAKDLATAQYMINRRSGDGIHHQQLIAAFMAGQSPKDAVRLASQVILQLARAIVRHPLTPDQLTALIVATNDMKVKLIFAEAAARIEGLCPDVLRGFFRHIEGDAQREVSFIDAACASNGETFFVLLIEAEFEETCKACFKKLQGQAFSLATIEYWAEVAERQERSGAARWFNYLIEEKYRTLPMEYLLDALATPSTNERSQGGRALITRALSFRQDELREIAGITSR